MLWVERRRRVEFFNLFAAEMTQNSAARRTDMWSRGLHGEGQTIGIGDTGIDHDNCFFRDAMVPVPIGRVDPRHRKIVAYWPDSDSGDALGGHGTHVAGSAVGQSISPEEGIDRINGIAWAAKVAFTDMDPLSVSAESSLTVEKSVLGALSSGSLCLTYPWHMAGPRLARRDVLRPAVLGRCSRALGLVGLGEWRVRRALPQPGPLCAASPRLPIGNRKPCAKHATPY